MQRAKGQDDKRETEKLFVCLINKLPVAGATHAMGHPLQARSKPPWGLHSDLPLRAKMKCQSQSSVEVEK